MYVVHGSTMSANVAVSLRNGLMQTWKPILSSSSSTFFVVPISGHVSGESRLYDMYSCSLARPAAR